MSIYTRTGDQGQTSLVGGQRVNKTCARLESYGTIDELCSQIGLLITYCSDENDLTFLTNIQNALFVVGGYLATDNSQHEVRTGNIVTSDMVAGIEQEIAAGQNGASSPLPKKEQKWTHKSSLTSIV